MEQRLRHKQTVGAMSVNENKAQSVTPILSLLALFGRLKIALNLTDARYDREARSIQYVYTAGGALSDNSAMVWCDT